MLFKPPILLLPFGNIIELTFEQAGITLMLLDSDTTPSVSTAQIEYVYSLPDSSLVSVYEVSFVSSYLTPSLLII